MNPNDPLSWFEKGDRDFALVQDMLPNQATYPDLICYHCQQAVEKYLKSLIVQKSLPLKRTRDLEELLDILATSGMSILEEDYDNALKINDYAVLTRYPSTNADPSESDVNEAILIVEHFRNIVIGVLGIKV
jgi:HEPN domain-containing protein